VYRAAYRVVGNAADAEDVVQTVFLRLTRRPFGAGAGAGSGPQRVDAEDAGRPEPTSRRYLCRAAINAGLDVLRSRQRAGWVPLETSGSHLEAGGADANPEHSSTRRQLRSHLRLAVSRLSPRAAEMFALRYFEELPNQDIAELLGISQTLVAVMLHRTRARLRKELAQLGGWS
jgi:RNA polymerase sigma-70 factor (ECF subfamily)